MPFDSFSIYLINFLKSSFTCSSDFSSNSSDFSSDFTFFLNPSSYRKIPVLNTLITSCLFFNNFSAAFKVSSLAFIFFGLVGLYFLSLVNNIFISFCSFSASLSELSEIQ